MSAGQSSSPIMCFNDNGYIGIATTSPGFLLTLAGNGDIFAVDNKASFTAKNSAGTYETYLCPRWSDNAMYVNYGSGGWYIRNNTSSIAAYFNGSGNFYMNGLVAQNANYGNVISAVNGSNFMVSQLATTTYSYNGSWIGGLSIGSFSKGSVYSTINITGLASWYYSSGGTATLTMRLYGTGAGNYVYRTQNYFTNNTGNHVTFPVNFQYDVGANLSGAIYIYLYCSGSIASDTNDYVNLTVTILPN